MERKTETKRVKQKKPLQKTSAPEIKNTQSNIKSIHGIELDIETARKAMILSEIIGPPAAKRRRHR